ncbi:MAG: LysR family transcriptional regulator [Gammaproteobacteria bacterium]
MHVTLRQLKVFEMVAKHLSFTRAAEELHLTQPAVSLQISQLEENIGLPVIEKMGKKIYLTDAGKELFEKSRTISQQLEEAEAYFEEIKGIKGGHLKITVASTANYFCSRLLATFNKRIENLTVSLDVTNRKGLLRQLEDNETDLVIMGRPPADMDLNAEAFLENPLVIIASPDHPLAGQEKIPLSALKGEKFVVRERASGTRIAMERYFADKGIHLNTSMEMRSNESVQQAVQAGLGLGIVSIHTLELELETRRLVVLDVESFPIMRQWYIVHRRSKRLSPVAQAFIDFILSDSKTLIRIPGINI